MWSCSTSAVLPGEVIHHTYTDYREVAAAIKDMVIRGAPAIGVAAAMGVALGVERSSARTQEELRAEFPVICQTIAQTRPTAVDLFWAIERMKRRFEQLIGGKRAAGCHAARDGGRGARDSRRKTRHRRSHGPLRRGADACIGPGDDAVQCRSARHGGNRLGAGRDSRGHRRGPQAARARAGNAAVLCRARGSPRGNCTKAACRSR